MHKTAIKLRTDNSLVSTQSVTNVFPLTEFQTEMHNSYQIGIRDNYTLYLVFKPAQSQITKTSKNEL